VGVILAALLYVRRVSNTTTVAHVTPAYLEEGRVHILQGKTIPDFVTIVRIHGPFLFGATDKLQHVIDTIGDESTVVIIRLRNMTAIDATGLRAMEDAMRHLRAAGRSVIFCGAREQPRALMERAGFFTTVGADNLCSNIDTALARAWAIHDAAAPGGAGGRVVSG
jgi:SulP family sulfate permease